MQYLSLHMWNSSVWALQKHFAQPLLELNVVKVAHLAVNRQLGKGKVS